MHHEPGTTIVHTETWRGRLWAARPMTVVEDTDEGLLLWMPAGTVRLVPEGGHDRVVENLSGTAWTWTTHVWDLSTLAVVRPGDRFAIWASWLPSGEQFGYYVNLQEPMVRTDTGFEAMDLMLDVVVEPDLRWAWKDEHEVDELVRLGVYDASLADELRAVGRSVIQRVEAAAAPFDGSLLQRRPSDGPLPELPAALLSLASER